MPRYWRMAMRVGNQGADLFPKCRENGVAVIAYNDEYNSLPVVGDCRRLDAQQYKDAWRRRAPKNTTGQVSLWLFAKKMKKGDFIYVKSGKEISGKGRVVQEYQYDPRIGRKIESGWNHIVKVKWDDTFVPFECLLGAEQWTVLPLKNQRLRKLRLKEGKENRGRNRRNADLAKGIADEVAGIEGEPRRRLVQHRRRESRLREYKIRQVLQTGQRVACEVPGCGFDFQEVYGALGSGFAHVHHLKPLGKVRGKCRTKLEDLAIVCANCHAMIHKGGECRPLRGLIKHKN